MKRFNLPQRAAVQRALHKIQKHLVPAQNLKRLYAITNRGPSALMHLGKRQR